MPRPDANPWIDQIGWIIVLTTPVGVLVHGLMRLFFAWGKD